MCKCKKYKMALEELMCRCYYQVLVSAKRDDNIFIPEGFGSSFLFAYKSYIFLISAEHVLSTSNCYFDLDSNKDYIGGIYTNKIIKLPNGQFSPEMVCFFIDKEDYTKYFTWDNNRKKWVSKRADMFYYPISNNPQFKGKEFLTQGQLDNNGNPIYYKLVKIVINEECISEPNSIHTYAIYGLVQNDIHKNQIIGKSIYHHGLTFLKKEKDSYFFSVSQYDERLDKQQYWAGLSGTAVFDEETGQVVGIAIMYDEKNYTLEVFPMKQICSILDGYINSRAIKSDAFRCKKTL